MAERARGRLERAARNLDQAIEALSKRMLAEAKDPESDPGCKELAELAKTIRQAVEIDQALGGASAGQTLSVVMEPDVRAYSE